MKYYLLIMICFTFCACNPKTTKEKRAVQKQNKEITDTIVQVKKDSSISHTLLFKYFPQEISTFNTIGYPDKNDNPTGLPTGETASPYTFPKFISFAKHLYEKKGSSVAIEILDYNIKKEAIYDIIEMMAIDSAYENNSELNNLYNLSITNTKASYKIFKNENKCEMHIILCNRFVINIHIFGEMNGFQLLKKVASSIPIKSLMKDYCDKNGNQ